MGFVVRGGGESLSTDRAVIAKLAGVKLHVFIQVAFSRKLLVAFFTHKWLFVRILSFWNWSEIIC